MMRLATVDVAVSIVRAPDGRVLLAERTPRQVAAGFWELPGGKIDPGEAASAAAARELEEEIGIRPRAVRPWIAYSHAFRTKCVRLQFFRIEGWSGQPHGREGQRLAWVDPAAPAVAPLLPSNERVLLALGLPALYGVAEVARHDGAQAMLDGLPGALQAGLRLIQVRAPELAPDQQVALARRVDTLARPYGARVLLCGAALLAQRAGVLGVHASAAQLRRSTARPPVRLWVVSCHDAADLARAVQLGADAAVLSPVLPCSRHPARPALGWDGLARLATQAPIPVYAQGGMTPALLAAACRAGAAGIASDASGLLHDDAALAPMRTPRGSFRRQAAAGASAQ
jgi:8-oxo-dGTP diphosphatase